MSEIWEKIEQESWEGEPLSNRIERTFEALRPILIQIVDERDYRSWQMTPNQTMRGMTPTEVIASNQLDIIREVIERLYRGEFS